jgi:hypothetical protein
MDAATANADAPAEYADASAEYADASAEHTDASAAYADASAEYTDAPAASGDDDLVMELQKWPADDNSSSATCIAYTPLGGHEKLMQLNFTQPLQLERGPLRRPVAVEATVQLQLAACCDAGRLCIKLQQLRACLQPSSTSSVAGSSSAKQMSSWAMLEDVVVQFSATTIVPEAERGSSTRPCFTTRNPASPGKRVIRSVRQVGTDFYRCMCGSLAAVWSS